LHFGSSFPPYTSSHGKKLHVGICAIYAKVLFGGFDKMIGCGGSVEQPIALQFRNCEAAEAGRGGA
jgi:hypothetical protein